MPLEKELIQKASDAIGHAARVLLVVPSLPSLDISVSAELLSRRIKSLGKDALLSQKIDPPTGWEFLPLTNNQTSSASGQDVLITVDAHEAPVGELRYEKRDDAFVIILSPKEKGIPLSAIHIMEGTTKIDCVVTLGVPSLDTLGEFFQRNPRLFFETPIIAIDHSRANDRHGEVNVIDEEASSITEVAWQLAASLAPGSMRKEEATLILAGIFSKTGMLPSATLGPRTLSLLAECMAQGGDHEKIRGRLLRGSETLPVLQLSGRAATRSRLLEEERMLISILTADDFRVTGTNPGMAREALSHVAHHLPTIERIILFWQDPETRLVSGIIQAPHGELSSLERTLKGRREADRLFIGTTFASFAEAEQTVIPLFVAP